VLAGLDTGHADYSYAYSLVSSILGAWEDYYDAANIDEEPTFAYLPQGAMESWPSGDTSPPDGFTLVGAGASVVRGTTGGPPDGSEFAKLTRSGADAALRLVVPSSVYPGFRLGCRAWVQQPAGTSSVSLQTRITGTTFGAVNPDSHRVLTLGEWLLLENRTLIPETHTEVAVQLRVITEDGEGWMGGIRVWPILSVETGVVDLRAFQFHPGLDLTDEAERIADAVQGVADTRSSIRLTVGGVEIEADTGSVVES